MKAVTLFLFVFLTNVSIATASPFYTETFRLCELYETSSKSAMDLAGWKAFRSNSLVGKVGFLKVNSPGSLSHPTSYNSDPRGPVEGSAFWSKNVSGLTVFTDEFAFDVSSLKIVQYEQRLGGYDIASKSKDGSQLALLIGRTWYISDQIVMQQNRGTWESVTYNPSELTFGTSPSRNGIGPERPGNFGIKLPLQGYVTAFGLFFPKVTGKVRIDNFSLSDSLLDLRLPGEQGSAAQCETLTGITSGSNNVSNSGEQTISTPQLTGRFCEGISAKALGRVKADSQVKSLLLSSISGKSLLSQRDRAVIALLVKTNLRIDNLVNVAVRDYYSVGSIKLLNASGITRQTTPVRPKVQKLIEKYLSIAGLLNQGQMPLFQSLDSTEHKLTSSALCTADLKRIVLNRAKSAKLHRKIKILS